MLHLTSGVALRMDIRDFLQFERPLQSNREILATPKVQKISGLHIGAGNPLRFTIQLQRLLKQFR